MKRWRPRRPRPTSAEPSITMLAGSGTLLSSRDARLDAILQFVQVPSLMALSRMMGSPVLCQTLGIPNLSGAINKEKWNVSSIKAGRVMWDDAYVTGALKLPV